MKSFVISSQVDKNDYIGLCVAFFIFAIFIAIAVIISVEKKQKI